MPIFDYRCDVCGLKGEKYTRDGTLPPCECGGTLVKLPSFPAMVMMRGDGLYPSEQKHIRGTAPFTQSYKIKAWGEYDHNKVDMHGDLIEA